MDTVTLNETVADAVTTESLPTLTDILYIIASNKYDKEVNFTYALCRDTYTDTRLLEPLVNHPYLPKHRTLVSASIVNRSGTNSAVSTSDELFSLFVYRIRAGGKITSSPSSSPEPSPLSYALLYSRYEIITYLLQYRYLSYEDIVTELQAHFLLHLHTESVEHKSMMDDPDVQSTASVLSLRYHNGPSLYGVWGISVNHIRIFTDLFTYLRNTNGTTTKDDKDNSKITNASSTSPSKKITLSWPYFLLTAYLTGDVANITYAKTLKAQSKNYPVEAVLLSQNMETIEKVIKEIGINNNTYLGSHIGYTGNLAILQYFQNHSSLKKQFLKEKHTIPLIATLILRNHEEGLRYSLSQYPAWKYVPLEIFTNVLYTGNRTIFDYLRKALAKDWNSLIESKEASYLLTKLLYTFIRGRDNDTSFTMLQYARGLNPPVPYTAKMINIIVSMNNLPLLEWVYNDRDGKDYFTVEATAECGNTGNIEILIWLRSRNVPWNTDVLSKAAFMGHFPIIEWARAQKPPCKWNDSVMCAAASRGNLEMFLRLQDMGCPMDIFSCIHASGEVRLWLRNKPDCPCKKRYCTENDPQPAR